MKIIISPAKKMAVEDGLPWRQLPVMLHRTENIKDYMTGLDYAAAKALWKCNDKLAELNYDRFSHMDLQGALSPAVFAYEGIQYQYMAPGVMDVTAHEYLQEHLRILSGFYGILRPFDGIVPYRLEMQAKARVNGCRDLYEYWGDSIYKELFRDKEPVLNLASKEYSKVVEPYLQPDDIFIACTFMEEQEGKLRQKATLAKMARGDMVRFLAEIKAEAPEKAMEYTGLGFRFSKETSSEREYVFIK